MRALWEIQMKLAKILIALTIAFLPVQSVAQTLPNVPVEKDVVFGPNVKEFENRQAVLNELAALIRKSRWKCDSISAARMFVFSRGFSVSCNKFAYKYNIEDKGGRWVVELD